MPVAAQEALHRYANERRAAAYFLLTAAMAGEIPAPTAEQLQASSTSARARSAPPNTGPYRSWPSTPPRSPSPTPSRTPMPASATSSRRRSYGTPERRTIQQITFPSQAEAEAAAAKIKEGATFEAIAAERNVSPQDLELGTFTKAEMLDPAVADAAFGLAAGSGQRSDRRAASARSWCG